MASPPEADSATPAIADLFLYPVKSCMGVALPSASVLANGLALDREWMIVDADSGACLTQREIPRMARVRVRIEPDSDAPSGQGAKAFSLVLSLEDCAGPGATIRVRSSGEPGADPGSDSATPRRRVSIWGHSCDAIDEGDEAARALDAWFGRPAGKSSRLVRATPEHDRKSPFGAGPGAFPPIRFPDASPIHLVSRATLDDLNARLSAAGAPPATMERFRPNFVVVGCEAGAEDRWKRIRIRSRSDGEGEGAVELVAQGPCPRCAVVTIDPTTGERGKEPLATLAGYRKQGFATMFGRYFAVAVPGVVEVGAEIEVLEAES